jgi:citrate synthase
MGSPGSDHFSAKQAADFLRIKPQTLYSYVSRGWIRSIGKDKKQGFLYAREDVERLRARGHARAEGEGVFKLGAPRWSEPIVQSSITKITTGGPEYRGLPALALARAGHRFENVAEMLWTGTMAEERLAWRAAWPDVEVDRMLAAIATARELSDPVKPMVALATAMALRPSGSDDIRDGNTVLAARELLTSMPGCIGYLTPLHRWMPRAEGASIASAVLAGARVAPSQAAVGAVNAALVLLADHELTPQTFAARLASSSGASLYHCMLSALSVHSGSRIRRSCDRIEDVLAGARSDSDFRARFSQLRASFTSLPGFNHPLYPAGDPRAEYLIELARALSTARRFQDGERLEEVFEEHGARPSAETGLVVLCRTLKLPHRSAGAILTIARSAGWMAHCIEQRMAGMMLRPKARFNG